MSGEDLKMSRGWLTARRTVQSKVYSQKVPAVKTWFPKAQNFQELAQVLSKEIKTLN